MVQTDPEVFASMLLHNGFLHNGTNDRFNCEGSCYTLSPAWGHGYYWMYACENRFAVTIQDFVFHKDVYMEYVAPACICVSYYDSVSGAELQPYKRINPSNVSVYIGRNDLYKAIFHKHVPVRCMSIILLPEYYRITLPSLYPNDLSNPEAVFSRIDEMADFPEMTMLLRQIQNCRYTGTAAKLFFESKVSEAISLVLHRGSDVRADPSPTRIFDQDRKHLKLVEAYIREHYAAAVPMETLARIACMSPSKLKYTFKQAHNCTIHAYVKRERMKRAEQLLAASDLSIEQISQRVGYRKASHFASAFRESVGWLPSEYRKRLTLS